MQSGSEHVDVLFGHTKYGADLKITPTVTVVDEMDVYINDFNEFASGQEIVVTVADAQPAHWMPLLQDVQYFIMKFIELLTRRNAFAIDFWANPIAQA
ncbi:MAG: hypothetical protein EZS28_046844 [Streblomastix strix]|uniref:Uncharacterized protein n=1 Tax=Streblomastix strix TaxID=222440 RepID=A0A5J4THM7_9EUKA|nr:MAG: hypothetical protein EZS28_046844 [Streblomastix strix]